MASRGTFLLVAVDPDDPGTHLVIDEAAALARDLGVGVRLLAAAPHGVATRASKMLGLDDDEAHEAEHDELLKKLEALTEPFELNRVEVRCVVGVGEPAQVVLERARLARLVVVGTHGRKGLPRMLLNSVAETIIRDSPTPVVVVRTQG